jgi:murein DD-endopeptidase MepM/ murein hydrolase activator NlpD
MTRLSRTRLFGALIIALAIPLLLAAPASRPVIAPLPAAPGHAAPALRYADLTEVGPAELPEHSLVLTMERNDTLASVLTAGGLSRPDSAALTRAFGESIDVRRLRPGHLFRFHYDVDGGVDTVQMKVLGWGDLEAVRHGDAEFQVTPRPAEQRSVISTTAATIDSSLYEAVRGAGEQPQLMQQIVDVFQWDVDFFQLQKGDQFSLVVEKKFAGPQLVGYGPILAARFITGGVVYDAFRHEAADGRAGYYSREGTPLRKQFLKAPLKFTRITSGFSKRRFHPVLRYFRPHHGVDYGAPAGTPVMTTADGVVVEARRNGGEGNVVRIRHTSKIETSYLHLSRFAKGIKRGTRVMQGDVIGYVGQTGLATGPHLDYRVRENGKWLDPLKLRSITPDPLPRESLRRFQGDVAAHLPRLASEPQPAIAQNDLSLRALF